MGIIETNILKGMFALFYKDGRISGFIRGKYSRNQFINSWINIKTGCVIDVKKICVVFVMSYAEAPKIQLMLNICASCFRSVINITIIC